MVGGLGLHRLLHTGDMFAGGVSVLAPVIFSRYSQYMTGEIAYTGRRAPAFVHASRGSERSYGGPADPVTLWGEAVVMAAKVKPTEVAVGSDTHVIFPERSVVLGIYHTLCAKERALNDHTAPEKP